MVSLELEYEGDTQVVEDLGTWELGERDGTGGSVLRYTILDPTSVAAGTVEDTAGEPLGEGSWFAATYPPILGYGPTEDRKKLTFNLGMLRFVEAEITSYRGGRMVVFEEGTNIGNAVGVDATLTLER